MANKKSVAIPSGQSNLFDLFGMDANKSTVEIEARPSQPQIQEESAPIKKPAPPVLPEGWAVEDIRFLLGILESARILVADTKLGIPTIHDDFGAEVQHCGFGVMKVAGQGYKLIFDAGGAMERTPSGKGWTRLDIRNGKYPYDSKAVREKLEAYLPKDDPSQVADPSPALPEEPGPARGPRLAEKPTEEMEGLAKEVYRLYQQVGHDKSNREAAEELTTKLNALYEIEKDLVNLMDEERRAGVKRPDLVDKTRAIDREVKDGFWDFHKYVVPFLKSLTIDPKDDPQRLENISRPADDAAKSEQSDQQPVDETSEDELVTLAEEVKEMKQASPKIPVEEQAKEFNHDLGYFTGTEKWTRYQGLCPHIILLTDGALYVAEHGGEDGNSAFWLIDAIASYQGEDALKRHTFQVWKLCLLPPDPEEPDVPPMSVGAVLKSKQGDSSPTQPRNPCRHAVLTC